MALLLSLAMLALTPFVPAWGRMWTLILGLFWAAKWLTWRRAARLGLRPTWGRYLGYVLAWPGMNARMFLDPLQRAPAPPVRAWVEALVKLAFGALLIWGVCPRIGDGPPVLVGWVGVIGMGFVLFFGLASLAALFWQRAGVVADPIWRRPAFATSPNDFWSNRWNLAFRDVARDLIVRPLAPRVGVRAAAFLVYVTSGIAHEVVLSVPARGGFGLPTIYFLIQAGGVALERTGWGERAGLRSGWTGRVYAALVTAGPAYVLFHPPFIRAVILPFLAVVGAGSSA